MRGNSEQPGLHSLLAQQNLRIDAHTSAEKLLFTVSHIIHDPLVIVANMLQALCQLNATSECVMTEINTIAQEFTAIQSDAVRAVQEVTRETCNPEHPFAQFPTGNADTFTEHSVEEITQAVVAWLDEHIQADNIAIHIVCAVSLPKLDLSILQHLLASVRPKRCVFKSTTTAKPVALYLEQQQSVELLVATRTAQPRIILSFALDISHIPHDAIELFLFILNYPPLTSVPRQLCDFGLVKQYHVDTGLHTKQTLELNINISLTTLGVSQYSRIVRLWLLFLAHQHAQPIHDIVVHQLSRAMAWRECFSDDIAIPWPVWFERISSLERISSPARINIPEEKNTPIELSSQHTAQTTEYSQQALQQLFEQCSLERMRLLFLAEPGLLPQCDTPVLLTRWYATQYQIRPLTLPHPELNDNEPLVNDITMELFTVNRFIAQLPALTSQPVAVPLSSKHVYSAHHDLYYESDKRNHKPIVEMFLALESTRPDAASIIAKRIWVSGIEDKLSALKYSFTMIGGNVKIYPNQTGLTIMLACPDSLLMTLLADVLAIVQEPLLLIGNFTALHQQQIDKITQRRPLTAYESAFSQLSAMLCQQPTFYEYHQMEALHALNAQQVSDYHQGFFASCYGEALIFGNASKANLEHINTTLQQLTRVPKPAPSNALHQPKERLILTHSTFSNSCFVTLLLTQDKTLKATILSMVLAEVLAEPFFERFRQDLQIGYDIGSGFITHQQHPGISFYLNYSHHSALSIYQYQIEFFTQMRLALHQFAPHWPVIKQSLCHQLSTQPLGFSQQAQYIWMQMGRLGGIEHDTKLVKELHAMEFAEFLAFSLDLLDMGGNHCIFSVSAQPTDASIAQLKEHILST